MCRAMVRQIAARCHVAKGPERVEDGGDELQDMFFRGMLIAPHYVPLAKGPDKPRLSGVRGCMHERRLVLTDLGSGVPRNPSAPASPTGARLAVLMLPGSGA